MTIRYNPRPIEALGSGFVPIPETLSLFSHSKIPGLLFKRVRTLEQAMSCGGFVVVDKSTKALVGWIGRSMWAAYYRSGADSERATFGKIRTSSQVKLVGTGPILAHSNNTRSYQDAVYVNNTFVDKTIVDVGQTDVFMLGIVTKATDGHFAYSGNPTTLLMDERYFPITGEEGIEGTVNEETAGDVDGDTSRRWITGLDTPTGCMRMANRVGFISIDGELPRKPYFASAKPAMMADVDEDVREIYSEAFDEELAETPVDATIPIQTSLHLWPDGTWAALPHIVQVARDRTALSGPTLVQGPRKNGPLVPGTPFRIGQYMPANVQLNGDGPTDAPVLEHRYHTNSGDIDNARMYEVRLSADAQAFDAFAVPFATVKLSTVQPNIPARAVFPGLLIISKPTTGTPVGQFDFNLQKAAMVDGFTHYGKWRRPVVIEDEPADEAAADQAALDIAQAELEVEQRNTILDLLRPHVPLQLALVDLFIKSVDSRAKEKVG